MPFKVIKKKDSNRLIVEYDDRDRFDFSLIGMGDHLKIHFIEPRGARGDQSKAGIRMRALAEAFLVRHLAKRGIP